MEVHPDFKFDKNKDSGFVPFKFQLTNSNFSQLIGKELMSGFELYINDFDLAKTKEALRPKQGFFNKLLGKKEAEVLFATSEIELRLKNCTRVTSFVWHAGDSFQLRFASLTRAILTELMNGVCCYPADKIWYNNDNIVAEAFDDVSAFEKSLSENEIKYYEFLGW